MPGSNDVRKFFVKALAFIVGISLIFNVSGALADRVAPLEDWRIDHQQRIVNLQARSDLIEAITLGNSHSDAIDYSVLGIDGQSVAFAAADLFEVEKYAVYLEDLLPNLKTVFIAISYYSFSRDNGAFEPFRTRRIRFYSVVPAWSPIEGDLSNFWLGRVESYTHVMSVVRSDSWQEVWKGLSDNIPPAEPFPYDGVRTVSVWGECSHYTTEQLDLHAREIARRNVTSSRQMAEVHPGLEQDASDALARTIKRLQSRGIRVILFTPTYYEKYNEFFMEQGSSIVEDMNQLTGKLQQIYRVEYYNFSDDPEIAIYPELFYNSDHLNECGHKVFSGKLLEKMGEKSKLGKEVQLLLLIHR
jgi:hypothetical protein